MANLDPRIGLALAVIALALLLNALFFGFLMPIEPFFDQIPAGS